MFLTFLFLLFSCTSDTVSNTETGSTVEEVTYPWDTCSNELQSHACNFSGVSSTGPEDLYSYYEKPIVIELATMWCGYCQLAGSEAQSLQDQYADKDLVYLTVLVENFERQPPTLEDLDSWNVAMGIIDAPVWASSREIIGEDPSSQWSATGWPTFYFIGRDMKVEGLLRGYSEQSIINGIEYITKLEE